MINRSKFMWGASVAALSLATILVVSATDYPSAQGSSSRNGIASGDLLLNTPGRMLLRWADPKRGDSTVLVDNWDTVVAPLKAHAVANPLASWVAPVDGEAAFYVDTDFTQAAYRYAFTVPSAITGEDWLPDAGFSASTFSWVFPDVQTDEQYQLFVNIPVGPTDTDPSATYSPVYQQRYQVYEITGVKNPDGTTDPVRVKIDTFTSSGQVQLGYSSSVSTSDIFIANGAGTPITVKLINTIPRENGVLTETANTVVVYADSARMVKVGDSTEGSYTAQPIVGEIPGDTYPFRVFGARNEPMATQVGAEVNAYNLGVVTSYRHNGLKIDAAEPGFGGSDHRNLIWSWPARRPYPDTDTERTRYLSDKRTWVLDGHTTQVITRDNLSQGVTWDAAFLPSVATPNFKGEDLLTTTVIAGTTPTARTHFRPNMTNGTYTVDVWSPGDAAGATEARVEILTGGLLVGTATVDFSSPGWKRLKVSGSDQFTNFGDFEIAITNVSSANEVGATVFADMVRVTKVADLRITSTPVFANVSINDRGARANRRVAVVATETGKLYCLDAVGNGDGTTRVYWSYPSELPTGTPDPNQAVGLDGPDGIAEMPVSFNTSSAAIARFQVAPGQNEDLLYIAGSNGKVYCISMTGRGDNTLTRPGTTWRRWSWPNDYPGLPVNQVNGPFEGSIAVTNVAGNPTVMVPTSIGRMYALDAVGDLTTKDTTERWQFPAAVDPTIDPIRMTPAVDFGRVYFGAGDQFYAVNAATGLLDWQSAGAPAFTEFGNASPATISGAILGGTTPTDTVYVPNSNGYVYSLDATTGNVQWATAELGGGSYSSLAFTYMTTYRTNGTLDFPAPPGRPVVIVPQSSGYNALFARIEDNNSAGGRFAWGYSTEGNDVTPVAFGGRQTVGLPDVLLDEEHTFMYGADSLGNLYAWNYDPDYADDSQFITPGVPPGGPKPTPDEPLGDNLEDLVTNARTAIIPPALYDELVKELRAGTLDYANMTSRINAAQVTRNRFEYGETVYMITYDLALGTNYDPDLIYSIEYQLTAPFTATQRRVTEPRQLATAPADREMVAFAQFPILGTGNNALAPGNITVNSRAIAYRSATNRQQAGNLTIQNVSPSRTLLVAHPLGVSINPNGAGGIGVNTLLADNNNFVNGNPGGVNLPFVFGKNRADQSGRVPHGDTGVSQVFVWDRSLMVLQYGPQRGLQNVRFATRDMNWNFGAIANPWATVTNPLNFGVFTNFEQPPTRVPNTSPDYPDIRRDAMFISKETAGEAQNPLFQAVGLEPPTYSGTALTDYRADIAQYNTGFARGLRPTRFDMDVDVPRFQPFNALGYLGQQTVYVDANQPGRQFSGIDAQEPYRDLLANVIVDLDERITIDTPTVDLEDMPVGAGFSPVAPWNNAGFAIDSPQFHSNGKPFYKRFVGLNLGNVNLLNVRAAKVIDATTQAFVGLALQPGAVVEFPLNLHTDLDPRFLPAALGGNVAFPKARPGDSSPSRLRVNPTRPANPVTGATQGPVLGLGVEQNDPKVAVSVPLGAPAGAYEQDVWLFDDTGASLNQPEFNTGPDLSADKPIRLRFTVTQARLTNKTERKGAPMLDTTSLNGNEPFAWANQQPAVMRDGAGNLIVAFASDRIGNSNQPEWLPRLKGEADTQARNPFRIYVGGVRGNTPAGSPGTTAMRDINGFTPATNGRWFTQDAGPFPADSDIPTMFEVQPGETIEPNSASFGYPTFSTAGPFDPLAAVTSNGRNATQFPYLAFLGTARIADNQGNVRSEMRLFVSRLQGVPGNFRLTTPTSLMTANTTVDAKLRTTRPAIIQSGGTALVFFGSSSTGTAALNWAKFQNGSWVRVENQFVASEGLSTSFESVDSVGVATHNEPTTGNVVDLAMAAKLRGRATTEVYYGRLNFSAGQLRPTSQFGSYFRSWDTLVDKLDYDASSGGWWSQGAEWTSDNAALSGGDNVPTNNPAAVSTVDIMRREGANYISILDHSSKRFDGANRVMTARTTLGGTVVLNFSNGLVKFEGALLPRNTTIYLRYRPRLVRVSEGGSRNYRGVALMFDDRIITDGVGYFNADGSAATNTTFGTVDRLMFTYQRTGTGEDRGGLAYRSLRVGIRLPYPARADRAVTVTGVTRPYQVDWATGRIYLSMEDLNKPITVTYTALDNGNSFAVGPIVQRSGYLGEAAESPIPVVDGANEGGLSVALDAQNSPFNSTLAQRPNMYWVIWAGTRFGSPDVYFQAIAPRFSNLVP